MKNLVQHEHLFHHHTSYEEYRKSKFFSNNQDLIKSLNSKIISLGSDCELGFMQEFMDDSRSYLTKFAAFGRQLLPKYLERSEELLFTDGVIYKKYDTDELFIFDETYEFLGHTKIKENNHDHDSLEAVKEKIIKHYKFLERNFLMRYITEKNLYIHKCNYELKPNHLIPYSKLQTDNYFLFLIFPENPYFDIHIGGIVRYSDKVLIGRLETKNNGVDLNKTAYQEWYSIIYNAFAIILNNERNYV